MTAETHPGIGKGLDLKMLAAAVGIAALGAAAAYIGLFTRHGVRIGPVPIPLSVVGPLLMLAGVVVLVASFRQVQCLACHKPLESALAWFPLEAEKQIVPAAMAGDPGPLDRLPLGNGAGPNIEVSIDFCESCRQIAMVEVTAFRPARDPLVPRHALTGQGAGLLADLIKHRQEAHEERFEEAVG